MNLPGVWVGGRLVDDAEALLRYDDHGFTVGDGAFETLKIVGGRPFALRRHLDRLGSSLSALHLPVPPRDELEHAVHTVAAQADEGFLRVTVTGGVGPLGSPRDDVDPTVVVAIRSGAVRVDPTDVVVVPWPRNERGVLAGVKSTSYAENVVALARAAGAGASEALFANTVGELCEGTGSNVFVVIDGGCVTPPLAAGCLAGITRALLLEIMPEIVERPVRMEELAGVTEMFLTSTGREVQPVSAVDGAPLPSCPGPVTAKAAAAWSAAYGPGGSLDP